MSAPAPTIDDLPRYSRWPARLLGLEPWTQRTKTAAELTREYEHEKWGPLLRSFGDRPVTLEAANAQVLGELPPTLCLVQGALMLERPLALHRAFVDFVASVLAPLLPATGLVELGAGYGPVILALAGREPFAGLPLAAAEYSESGVALIGAIARAERQAISVARCDFLRMDSSTLPIPEGALVFTSFATATVPHLPGDFVEAIRRRRPAAVVHFEPLYEHCSDATLLGLLRRRYIEVNDYNRNLLSLLRAEQARGSIELLDERTPQFGNNPLLAASVVAWRPR